MSIDPLFDRFMQAGPELELPDLIVIGDSHSNALVEGCLAHGLRVLMLRFSGNLWHAEKIVLHPEHGLWIEQGKDQQEDILALRQRLGGRPVLTPDVPVLGSFGFHLGRFVPVFSLEGHVTDATAFADNPESTYVSASMLDSYIGITRGPQIRMARAIARQTQLTLVAPPMCDSRPNMSRIQGQIARRMRALGLTVIDPCEEMFGAGASLPPDLLTADAAHGTADYGKLVVGHLIAQGQIAPRR